MERGLVFSQRTFVVRFQIKVSFDLKRASLMFQNLLITTSRNEFSFQGGHYVSFFTEQIHRLQGQNHFPWAVDFQGDPEIPPFLDQHQLRVINQTNGMIPHFQKVGLGI